MLTWCSISKPGPETMRKALLGGLVVLAAGCVVATAAGQTADKKKPADDDKPWACRAPVRPKLPSVTIKSWVRNPIDTFVLAGMEKEGVKPAKEADRGMLIRRLSFDLTGLPPTPEEVAAFLADDTA